MRSPEGEEGVGKPYNLFIWGKVPRLMMACTFSPGFPFHRSSEEAQGADEVGGAHQYHLLVVAYSQEVGVALDGEQVCALRGDEHHDEVRRLDVVVRIVPSG